MTPPLTVATLVTAVVVEAINTPDAMNTIAQVGLNEARAGWVERSATHQSLPINPGILFLHIAPLAGIHTELYKALERGIRPIHSTAHMPMLDRVEVDVARVWRNERSELRRMRSMVDRWITPLRG